MIGLFHKGHEYERKKFLRSKKSQLKKLVKEKKYDKVLKIGSEILEKNPDDLDVLFVIGGIHYMRGKYSKSISYFDKVLEISSYDPEVLLLKANSHYKLGQYNESSLCCEKIREIDPKNKAVTELLEKISNNSN